MNPLRIRSLGRRLHSYMKDPQVATWRKLAGLGAVAYLILPFDAVPDFIPIFGWLDDVGVLGLAAAFMARELKNHPGKPAS
jgi:uncharacterized membrane protein YkvA (DUF1232 family)